MLDCLRVLSWQQFLETQADNYPTLRNHTRREEKNQDRDCLALYDIYNVVGRILI